MTAQILASELGNLIQDSKRKNSELRIAAEKSLQDLKSLPVTSEVQLAADLARRPHFISPFLIACNAHNAKFGSISVSCLQRLGVARALPRERLTEVLEALRDSVTLSHDVQLKILQALPSLLQNYQNEIRGDSLSIALQICSALQNAKNFAVSNTAAATLQQLVISVFDRVVLEDDVALEIPTTAEITVDGRSIMVRSAAYDAYKVFNDLNLLVTGEKPAFIRFSSLPSTSTLELIEAILSNHGGIVSSHPEQIQVLQSLLMPMIIRSLSERLSFPVTLRIIRILNLLIRNHLTLLPSECEIALGLLNHMLDPEASPLWKRALCLEVFRGIYSDSRLVLEIYSQFDEQKGKRCIFGDNLAAFVRLSTEKPAVIGLGQQSTIPTGRGSGQDSASEQAVAEAGALAGVIGGPMPESNTSGHLVGISTQWSSLKAPCMENLDKSEPPAIPDTYIYSLVLTCITNISETLAKFILPLTVHHENRSKKKSKGEESSRVDAEYSAPPEGNPTLSRTQSYRKKTIPVNPLTLEAHSAHAFILTSSNLVNECWPAVLATCSTFLNAALDTEYYRALVRAIQKFTQVAGLLRLSTPRDAFLTTLGKSAVPPSLLIANNALSKTMTPEHPGVFSNTKALLSVDSLVSQTSSISLDKNRRPSHEVSMPSLGPRHLLCLRALLNIAIALGPTLQSAWSIVFETLQVADLIMAMSNQQSGIRVSSVSGSRTETDSSSEKVEAETSAVQAAARRLFESTVDFPNDYFVELLQALCALLNAGETPESGQRTPTSSVRPQIMHQRRMGSVSGISLNTETIARDSMFALNKIGELAALNDSRLAQYDPTESGWNVFVAELVRFSANDRKPTPSRLLAADILARAVKDIAEVSMTDHRRNEIQRRILIALETQISALLPMVGINDGSYDDTNVRIHQIALEALKGVIEQCGESLTAGWDSVFQSLLSVFASSNQSIEKLRSGNGESDKRVEAGHSIHPSSQVISKPLARSAFATVQLICSDFLTAVPDRSLATLLELLLHFSRQQDDLNMSLAAITFFWNVSDFLHSRSDLSSLPSILGSIQEAREVRQLVYQRSSEGAIPALWLQVLIYLSTATTDKRSELRNSAVHTIQRIFENCGDRLSPETWMLCLHTVLYAMVGSNLTIHKSIKSETSVEEDETVAWNETTKAVLGTTSILISIYMDNVDDSPALGNIWSDLLDYFEEYFHCGSHALGSSVFTTVTAVLARVDKPQILGQPALLKTADVWKKYFDHRNIWQQDSQSNQDAFSAYAEAFKTIYRLSGKLLEPSLLSMLSNLEACILDSNAVAYSSDVEHMTPLQTQVIECLSEIRSGTAGLPTYLIQVLSRLIVLPYTAYEADPDKRGPTFVALSKASMSLLQTVAIRHIDEQEIYTSGAFHSALSSLTKPIQQKYVWQREGKPPTVWQKATTTAIAIIKASQSIIQSASLNRVTFKAIWTQVALIAGSITTARVSKNTPSTSVDKDEEFDIESFYQLRELATVPLGSSEVSDSVRRAYARNLFENSIIHQPRPGEVPNLITAPLEDLYRIRFGHTDDPEPIPRVEMAYACFSELLSLVSVHDGSPERIRVAQAAAPYLILRMALPLRAYIADHPLRGRMPAPQSQHRELLFALKEIKKLNSEPQAIPDAPGITSLHKKHLHRIYPLLVKATMVARHDADTFRHLAMLTETVGDEFSLDDD